MILWAFTFFFNFLSDIQYLYWNLINLDTKLKNQIKKLILKKKGTPIYSLSPIFEHLLLHCSSKALLIPLFFKFVLPIKFVKFFEGLKLRFYIVVWFLFF